MSVANKEGIGLLQTAMEETSSPEKTFTVELTESELVLIIGQLWRCEHEQIILAHAAKREGNARHEQGRRESAAKALALANRLEDLGGQL